MTEAPPDATLERWAWDYLRADTLAHKLFEGGRMRRLPAVALLQPLTAVALVTVVALALTRLRTTAAALASRPVWHRRAVGIAAVVAGW